MSRREAFDTFTLRDFEKSMEGIYSSSVARETLDECPMVYKPMDEIVQGVKDTVTIDSIIRPIYNFKAGENESRGKRAKG